MTGARIPRVIYVLSVGAFAMVTSYLITAFAVAMAARIVTGFVAQAFVGIGISLSVELTHPRVTMNPAMVTRAQRAGKLAAPDRNVHIRPAADDGQACVTPSTQWTPRQAVGYPTRQVGPQY